jgi:hypothetical protein
MMRGTAVFVWSIVSRQAIIDSSRLLFTPPKNHTPGKVINILQFSSDSELYRALFPREVHFSNFPVTLSALTGCSWSCLWRRKGKPQELREPQQWAPSTGPLSLKQTANVYTDPQRISRNLFLQLATNPFLQLRKVSQMTWRN